MESLDKKNKIFTSVIIGLAVVFSVFVFVKNPYYAMVIIPYAIFSLIKAEKNIHRLILTAILLILGYPLILLTNHLLLDNQVTYPADLFDQFVKSFVLASLVLLAPFFLAWYYFSEIIRLLENQKKYNNLISNHPHLVCKEHFTKTKQYSMLGYKGVRCRFTYYCLEDNNIIAAEKLTGLIGVIQDGKLIENEYFVTLWDHRQRKIRYGDYDIIEIHHNPEIKDYDFVISKIITFFYNENNRFKPLHEVIIRIADNVPVCANTRILLQQHFLRVDYLTA